MVLKTAVINLMGISGNLQLRLFGAASALASLASRPGSWAERNPPCRCLDGTGVFVVFEGVIGSPSEASPAQPRPERGCPWSPAQRCVGATVREDPLIVQGSPQGRPDP